MQTYSIEQLERWIDRHAIDRDDHKLGIIADVYVDDATGRPEWIAVMTGLFGSRMSFVPLLGAEEMGDKVKVAYEKSLVKDSPNMDADGQLTEEEEERLYRHYGLTYTSALENGAEAELAELQEKGSVAHNGDVSPEAARTRLRRRDTESVEAIDLSTDDVDITEVDSRNEKKKS